MNLWIGATGQAMELNYFTKEVKRHIKAFASSLAITPIQFRRMTMTDVFAKRITLTAPTQEQAISKLGVLLNVSPAVMTQHYDRHVAYDDNEQVQTELSAPRIKKLQPILNKQQQILKEWNKQNNKSPFNNKKRKQNNNDDNSDKEDWQPSDYLKRKK